MFRLRLLLEGAVPRELVEKFLLPEISEVCEHASMSAPANSLANKDPHEHSSIAMRQHMAAGDELNVLT